MSESKLKLNLCGLHYGRGGSCSKCKLFEKQRAEHRNCYQWNGTPWIAIFEPVNHKAENK